MSDGQAREKEAFGARPPLPPFTTETAIQKVRLAEDGWNSRDPEKVVLAYTPDCRSRNRSGLSTADMRSWRFFRANGQRKVCGGKAWNSYPGF